MKRVAGCVVGVGCGVIFSVVSMERAAAAPVSLATAHSGSGIVGTTGESDDDADSGPTLAVATAESDNTQETPGYGILSTAGVATAKAQPGYLGASASAEVQSTWTGTLTVLIDNLAGTSSSALARSTVDDVIISTSLPGVTSIPASMFLEIGGSVSGNASVNGDFPSPFSSGTAVVTVGANIAGATFSGSRSFFQDNTQDVGTTSATGMLAGGDLFSTPPVVVPVNTPFQVELSIQVNAGAVTNLSHGNATAMASYANTFSFATSGSVFDLPPGYTANSVSARIVDNRFIIPEPASLELAWLGAAGICLCVQRCAQRRAKDQLLLEWAQRL